MFFSRPPKPSEPSEREPSEPTDQALIHLSQQGDRVAFNALLERYAGGAYALALRMTGDPETAADVTQEAFLSAFRAMGSFSGTSFRAWLLRIVSNGCYDVFRARKRHPTTSLDALLDPPDDGAPADVSLPPLLDLSGDPEQSALRSEVVAAIEAALLRLPDEQRLAILLSDVQGMPYDEVATIMGTPIGTVKSRIARGRTQLRGMLAREWEQFAPVKRPSTEIPESDKT